MAVYDDVCRLLLPGPLEERDDIRRGPTAPKGTYWWSLSPIIDTVFLFFLYMTSYICGARKIYTNDVLDQTSPPLTSPPLAHILTSSITCIMRPPTNKYHHIVPAPTNNIISTRRCNFFCRGSYYLLWSFLWFDMIISSSPSYELWFRQSGILHNIITVAILLSILIFFIPWWLDIYVFIARGSLVRESQLHERFHHLQNSKKKEARHHDSRRH